MPPLDEFSVKTLNEIISAGVSSKLIYEGSICESYPCWNEGACVESNKSFHGYSCFCNQMFTGTHCDIKTANNCTNIFCGPGTFCSLESANCIPIEQYDLYPLCDISPCLNSGICILTEIDHPQCLCPPHTRGLLCETPILGRIEVPMSWNALQFLFLFAVVFLLVSALLTFCYAGNYGCYLNWPRRPRYSKWQNGGELDLSWDDADEDEDLIGGQHLYRSSNGQSHQRASTTSTSKDCFEMKNKPLKISSTAETFITYNDLPTSSSNPHINGTGSANPSLMAVNLLNQGI